MTVTFRPATPADRAELAALTAQAFEGVSIDHGIEQALGPVPDALTWEERKARHLHDDLDAGDGALIVAVGESGNILGYVSLRFDRAARIGRIPNLAVAAEARNLGLGRRLLEQAIERFRAEGLAIARIETLEHNQVGRHLYPSLGFVEVARQVHYAMRLDDPPGPRASQPDTPA